MSDSPHPVEQSSPERVPDDIDKKSLPKHVAGRWAKQRGLSRTKGHEQGEQALYDVIYGARDIGVEWITVYAFSTENWKRPAKEVAFLMNFNEKLLLARLEELHEHDVRIRFIAFNYGGRAEIVDAVKSIVSKTEGKISEKDITEKSIASNLYCKEMPEVDLVIRSSGEERLSNFLLWQAAYAEFYFTKTLWPDMRREDLFDAIRVFQNRTRRFGAL